MNWRQRERREAEQAAAEEQLARLHAADQRVQEVERRLLHQHRQQGHVGLYGLTTVQKAFDFLPDPADVLRAAAACRRWRELACADSVWRARFEREGLVDKACAFEVALPPVPLVVVLKEAAAATAPLLHRNVMSWPVWVWRSTRRCSRWR